MINISVDSRSNYYSVERGGSPFGGGCTADALWAEKEEGLLLLVVPVGGEPVVDDAYFP